MTDELAVLLIRYIACRGRLRNLGEDSFKISLYRVTITWQQRFKIYGSRRFAACDCRTQTSVAGNAATADSNKSRCEKKHTTWKLKRNIAANDFYIRCEKKHCCQRSAFLGLLQLTWVIFCGVAKVKRYVNVYLHLRRQQPEMDNRMSTLPTLEKFLLTPMPVLFVFTI